MEGFNYIKGNLIHETAIIYDCVELGTGNIIGPYTVIGSNGEIRDKNPNDFKGEIVIGNGNTISEHVTIQRPFEEEDTFIGDNNIIMAHSHIGHDVRIGNDCEICTGTVVGGYVEIGNWVKIKLKSVIRNRIKIQSEAIIGMGSVVTKDVSAYSVVYGNPAKEK